MNKAINPYRHTAQYYETDRMGIIHHSNYIRWMEEARIDFLRQLDIRYSDLEASGLVSPIFEVRCQYRRMVKFEDIVAIEVSILKYTGTRLTLSYRMTNETSGEPCAEGNVINLSLLILRELRRLVFFHTRIGSTIADRDNSTSQLGIDLLHQLLAFSRRISNEHKNDLFFQ